jgi:hypothetical protein
VANILDPPGWRSGYGWPSLEVNHVNDIVMSYQRAGEHVFYEARYSVYPGAGPDIMPSNVLRQGEHPVGTANDTEESDPAGRIDISGSSVDPFDDNAIWMIQKYAVKVTEGFGTTELVVGKVFGARVADLYIPDISIRLLSGRRVAVAGEVGNGGDGDAKTTRIAVHLVRAAPVASRAPTRVRLAEFDLGELASGEKTKFSLTLKLPPGRVQASDRIEVMTDPRHATEEYTEENNVVQRLLPARPRGQR